MQGTWVQSLAWEDSTCHRATKPMYHNYWAPSLRAHKLKLLSPSPTTTEAHASQQGKPLQWEVHALQLESNPDLLQLECQTAQSHSVTPLLSC